MNIISSTFSVQIYHNIHKNIILHHESTLATIPFAENNTLLRSGNSALPARDARRANVAICPRRDRQTDGRPCVGGEAVVAARTSSRRAPAPLLRPRWHWRALAAPSPFSLAQRKHLGNVYRCRLRSWHSPASRTQR